MPHYKLKIHAQISFSFGMFMVMLLVSVKYAADQLNFFSFAQFCGCRGWWMLKKYFFLTLWIVKLKTGLASSQRERDVNWFTCTCQVLSCQIYFEFVLIYWLSDILIFLLAYLTFVIHLTCYKRFISNKIKLNPQI